MTTPFVPYEPPAIAERAAVGGPLIGFTSTSGVPSPTWRRREDTTKETE
jgi:hypothetical protein